MQLPRSLWFKVQRLKNWWNSKFGERTQSYDTSHRMCPECRALIPRNTKTCPHCGIRIGPMRSRGGGVQSGVHGLTSGVSILLAANVILYIIEWFMTQRSGAPAPTGMFGLAGGISSKVMLRLGGKFGPLISAGQYWRLVTAMFLHAGILHIGFNMWVLVDIGAEVEQAFFTSKFTVLYLVTGVVGFIVSTWWSPFALSIGASGAIMGLLGVLIGASFHHGYGGKAYRSQLWRWVIYIFIFGLFFSVDNAAHFGGLVSGIILGYVIPAGHPETRPAENLWNALAVISVVIIAACFALMALQLNSPLYF